MACDRLWPHISAEGISEAHTAGRAGLSKIAQRSSAVSCTHGTPAGFPRGMPGMALLIDGAVQQAPQWERQSMNGWGFRCGAHGARRPLG